MTNKRWNTKNRKKNKVNKRDNVFLVTAKHYRLIVLIINNFKISFNFSLGPGCEGMFPPKEKANQSNTLTVIMNVSIVICSKSY